MENVIQRSNILAGSNIYKFSGKGPEYDEEYAGQVNDIGRLKRINERKGYDSKVASLSIAQIIRLDDIDRCMYAKDDPCWGFSFDKKKVISKCINGECHQIYKCNPNYSEEYAAEWQVDEQEILKYGNPQKLLRQYFVDLESQEEMNLYKSEPGYDGILYNSVDPNKVEGIRRKTRIDPETGKVQIVVGYKWSMIGGDYGTEVADEIWAFVDNEISRKNTLIVKAPVIQPLEISSIETMPIPARRTADNKGEVIDKIGGELSNSEAIQLLENAERAVLICDNLAERGFLSKTLTDYGISHGYKSNDRIQIVCKDQSIDLENQIPIIITAATLCSDNSDMPIWNSLLIVNEIYSLKPTNRAYRQVEVFNKTVDVCSNNYGFTHICIDVKDLDDLLIKEDGIYELELEFLFDRYAVMHNGKNVGYASDDFIKVIQQLRDRGDIAGIPVSIEGLQLIQNCGERYILGIGHMRFSEY